MLREPLKSPVYDHRFCHVCFYSAVKVPGHSCPLCRAKISIEQSDPPIDHELWRFLQERYPEECGDVQRACVRTSKLVPSASVAAPRCATARARRRPPCSATRPHLRGDAHPSRHPRALAPTTSRHGSSSLGRGVSSYDAGARRSLAPSAGSPERPRVLGLSLARSRNASGSEPSEAATIFSGLCSTSSRVRLQTISLASNNPSRKLKFQINSTIARSALTVIYERT